MTFGDFVFMPSASRTLTWHLAAAEREAMKREWTPYVGYVDTIRAWATGGVSDCPWQSD